MNNNLLQIKIKERLNKLGSFDYDNLECWQISEAYNKVQLEFVRNQIHGNNQHKEGDESSKVLIDDLQCLLLDKKLSAQEYKLYFETQLLPSDYLFFKRISSNAITSCCASRKLVIYEANSADVDNLLLDTLTKPNAEWGETFATLQSNRIRIYTNGEFKIDDPILTYYRKPKEVKFAGCIDPSTGVTITSHVDCEFKDDIAELLCTATAAILSGDIESMNQYQIAKQSELSNN